MESSVVHRELNDFIDAIEARRTLVCYLDYLLAYRRDVPDVDDYVICELQALPSTQYAKLLQKDDPIYRLLTLTEELEVDDENHNKTVWSTLKNCVIKLS